MTAIHKFFFLGVLFTSTALFADDIWFVSPQEGQSIQGDINIQIQPPYAQVSVNVSIEYDMGRESIVWRGKLTPQNNYSITVDTKKFKPGKYQIEAEYYIQGEDYDGDVEFWIGAAPGPEGEYFPQ